MDSGGRGPRGVAEEVREAVAKVRASGRPLLGDRELRAEGMARPRAYGRSMPGSSEQQQRGVSARVPDRLITRHHVQLAKGRWQPPRSERWRVGQSMPTGLHLQ